MSTRRPRVAAPVIDDLRLADLAEGAPDGIAAGGRYEALRYADADLAGRDLAGAAFSECEFLGLEANETRLRAARFIETRIERANAPVFKAARSTWRDVHVEGSRLGEVELYDADVQAVRIAGSKLSFVNLRAASLRDVHFDDCVIEELDLTQAQAERVAFTDCAVRSILLDHARLRDVDLRGLDLGGIGGIESMRGAVISFAQAVDLAVRFADHLGVAVVD